MKIPEYFTDNELNCPCCGEEPDPKAVEKLYAVRLLYNKPIKINSGARCKVHNYAVGGSVNSKHIQGIAFDIVVPERDKVKVLGMAVNCGFNGFGIYDDFMHIDTRDEFTSWWGK
jgi:uncharacterized protein YcbK (DUF882 family)